MHKEKNLAKFPAYSAARESHPAGHFWFIFPIVYTLNKEHFENSKLFLHEVM